MTNARSLANFATGIGTEGAVLTVDNTNNRIGIATTNPQNDLQVGLGITMEGDTGQVTFVGIVTAEGFRNSDGSVVGAASTDNINTSTLAQFTGGVGIADSIFHIGDDNTAIRFPAADTFTVETGGSERLRITGIGSVGIGDASPENTLTIKNIGSFEGDANSFYFGSNFTGTGTKFIGSSKHAQRIFINNASANGYLRYDNTGTAGNAGDTITWQERFRVTSAGDVGIGENSPDCRFHIKDTINTAYTVTDAVSSANNLIKIENDSTTANAFAGMQFRVGGGADMYLGAIQQSTNAGDFYFANQNSPNVELMRIKSTGLVGIGTDSPLDLLHITSASGDARVVIQGTANNDSEVKFYEGGTNRYTIGHDAATGEFRLLMSHSRKTLKSLMNQSPNFQNSKV